MRCQELIVTKLQRMTTFARKTIDIMKEENKVDGYIFNIIKYEFKLILFEILIHTVFVYVIFILKNISSVTLTMIRIR